MYSIFSRGRRTHERRCLGAPDRSQVSGPRPSALLAEVRVADEVRAQQGGGGVVEDDATGLDDVTPVRHAEGHAGVLLYQQDRGALAVDVLHDPEDGLDEDR